LQINLFKNFYIILPPFKAFPSTPFSILANSKRARPYQKNTSAHSGDVSPYLSDLQ